MRFTLTVLLLALAAVAAAAATAPEPLFPPGDRVTRDADGRIHVEPLPVDARFRNRWTRELEREFWERANHTIQKLARSGNYGTNWFESEKASYPLAMFGFLAGYRAPALAYLQSDDAIPKDCAHTKGIDFYPCFTLKGQMRKYFFFGEYLDPAYRERMREGARIWTEQDPLGRPHPLHGKGKGGEGWGPDVRGGWVDGRSTDNLRAMREVSVYLMAEETGNEATRLLYKQRLQRYVRALYHIGMGEWDSENYHGHSLSTYVNLYDFAKDPEVRLLGKAAMDWFCAAAALKYYRGGWGAPTKRDYGGANVVYGSLAARLMELYFGDCPIPDPEPERDQIHLITSAYRPPLAVMALARKDFTRPVEVLGTKPTYENWKPGGEDAPQFWETVTFGNTYQLGSVVSAGPDGDVGAFKLLAFNAERGVDYFAASTGGDAVVPGKRAGDQIGQYRNLAIWLRAPAAAPDTFCFQVPKSALVEVEGGVWFVRLEKTWIAIRPINLGAFTHLDVAGRRAASYKEEQTLRSATRPGTYTGFALEVGEEATHGGYEAFKQAVQTKSRLDLSALAAGTAQLIGATGSTLKATHNAQSDLPTVVRDGTPRDWAKETDLYRSAGGPAPISLGWKQGTLRIEAGGHLFTESVTVEGKVTFEDR